MALFAAYADANTVVQENENIESSDWLKLSSYQIGSSNTGDSKQEEASTSTDRKPKKHKKKSKKKSKHLEKDIPKDIVPDIEEEIFTFDTKRTLEFLNVATISRPAAPRYRIKMYINDNSTRRKPKKFKRYFETKIETHINPDEKLTPKDLEKPIYENKDEHFVGFQHEDDMTQTTGYYNRSLADDPNNIGLWIKYVHFQDMVFQFEKTFRKGSMAKGLRVTAERKLSIIEKALVHNPNCEELLRLMLNVAVSVYPADELQLQLGKLVEKEQSNIILWQGYIEATQCSMSHCNTPAVLELYIKCLHTLHTLRRNAKLEKVQLEENILRMLYQCGLFLKQAGLFEQLWTLLRLYLELSLSPSTDSTFNIKICSNDKQLVDLEEIVLNSQLPIHELWLRVEKLREACHWLPSNEECEDPQRVVFSEDVSDLIHPITMPGNTFRLTVTILTLLKLPLLPCRHTTMQEFGIDYVPWGLDSMETLLSLFLPLYPIDLNNMVLLKYTQKLTVGPQYLKTLPGQEEYLQFLLTIMQVCIDCTNNMEKIALTIWWFRFQRLLTVLEKDDLFKITATFKKKLKSDMKNILKQNPSNVVLFKEYALVLCESGNIDNAISVLKTSIIMSCANKGFSLTLGDTTNAAILSAFRTLIELYVAQKTDMQTCLKLITSFILGKSIEDIPRFLTQGTLSDTKAKFAEVTSALLENYNDAEKLTGGHHFLPDFLTDWIILNGWFHYINGTIEDCRILIENVLQKLDEINNEISWHKEVLYEFLAAVMFKNCTEVPGSGLFQKLDEIVQKSIELYPNNIFFLSIIAKIQSIHYCLGQPWWKVKNLLLKTGHALPNLFLVLIENQRISDIEETWTDTITGQVISPDYNFKNNMLSLFKRLTRSDMCTRRCGLVWRLYLQFLHTYFDPKMCRNAYYSAVEECPWLKALYVDAAIYIPEELAQIQDLIIEKQLRIHVTPEELDVLRN